MKNGNTGFGRTSKALLEADKLVITLGREAQRLVSITGFNLAGALHMNCRKMCEQMDKLGKYINE